MLIRNHVNVDRNFTLEGVGMKSTFIMAEIKIACKMGSVIHVFKCINAKITGK